MNSLILRVTVKLLFPLILIAGILSLFRGHNEPGGGFIGGLVAATAFILATFALSKSKTQYKIRPGIFIVTGMSCALVAFILPLFFGYNFSEAIWLDFKLPIIGKPGTPVLFDIGVFMIVIGAISLIVFSIRD